MMMTNTGMNSIAIPPSDARVLAMCQMQYISCTGVLVNSSFLKFTHVTGLFRQRV